MAGLGLEEIKKALLDGGVKSEHALGYAQTLHASPHSHLWNAGDLTKHAEGMVKTASSAWTNGGADRSVNAAVGKLAREGITDAHAARFTPAAFGNNAKAATDALKSVREANGNLTDAYAELATKTADLANAQASGWKFRITKAATALDGCQHRVTDLVFKANQAAGASKGLMPSVTVESLLEASVNKAGMAPVSWATRMIASSKGIEAMRHGEPFAMSHISFGKAIGWTALAALIGAGASNVLGSDATDTHRR